MDDMRLRMAGRWNADRANSNCDDDTPCDGPVKLGFELDGRMLLVSHILPGRLFDQRLRESLKYRAIVASIGEIGVIEPLVVYPIKSEPGPSHAQFLLLDGHMRLQALKDLNHKETFCLVSTDDEAYTYNQRVNRLQPIQEHFMILKAIERGVSEERMARALKLDIKSIRDKRDLLRGICHEAVELLKNTPAPRDTIRHLRIVKPIRQVEIVEMMLMVANFGSGYCQALVAATPKELISEDEKLKQKIFLNSEDVARVQREMETLQRDLHNHEETYGQNFLNLVIVRGYLSRLLDNGRVVRFLSSNHSDVLNAFQQVVDSTSLEG